MTTLTKLHEASLRNGKFRDVSFVGADLSNADLRGADIQDADFSNANLRGAIFGGAKISNSKFINSDLRYASFQNCLLKLTDLHGANLQHSRWSHATILLSSLNDCLVYGISAWDVRLKDTNQDALVITQSSISPITVDDLQLAQTIFLFLENRNIRLAIDAFAGKVVLVLGRFTPERKIILDAVRKGLRNLSYIPIVVDFDPPASRDITETVRTIAHLARFVIADINEPRSIPQELQGIIPFLPSVPIQPIIEIKELEYGMFEHFRSYPWVLPEYRYSGEEQLLIALKEHVIDPAETKARQLYQARDINGN